MPIQWLINTLESRGVLLWAEGDLLKWHDPQGILTPKTISMVIERKAEVLAFVKGRKPVDYLQEHMNSVILGDSMDILRFLPAECVDQMVCDPPYGQKLMGFAWDESIVSAKILSECLRVLKPGGFGFVFSSPRQELLASTIMALQAAGFDVGFTSLYWTYASGSPKATHVSITIDKKLKAEREIIGMRNQVPDFKVHQKCVLGPMVDSNKCTNKKNLPVTAPKTDSAKEFYGAYAGFDPKPAVEVILVAMKPRSEKSYTDQALSNGKGVFWFNNSRIPFAHGEAPPRRNLIKQRSSSSGPVIGSLGDDWQADNNGRFPANLLVSDEVLGKHSKYFDLDRWEEELIRRLPPECQATYPYLVVAKPSLKEKRVGLPEGMKNTNPCVKPVKLMSYLITMVSRPGDLILDPFAGSGSTLIAAKLLGRNFIGIEQSAEYHPIAEARVNYASPDDPYLRKITASAKAADHAADVDLIGKPPAGFFSNAPQQVDPSRAGETCPPLDESDLNELVAGIDSAEMADDEKKAA